MFRFFTKKWSNKPINRKNLLVESITESRSTTIKESKKELLQEGTIFSVLDEINQLKHPLKETCLNTVVFGGNSSSTVCIVGEAPGEQEDLKKEPFVGQAGQLLNEMLMLAGLDRNYFFVTNRVFWRPPNNRKPTPEEINYCFPFFEKLITALKPKYILCLGAVAIHNLIDINITRARGQFFLWKDYEVFATFHPSYVLRSPSQKSIVVSDLKTFANKVGEHIVLKHKV